MRPRFALAFLFVLSLGFATPRFVNADAKTKIDVDAGWGWKPRAEHWMPVFVTASTDKPRNAILTIEWPQGGSYLMRIEQAVTLDVAPRTFPILVPIHGLQYDQASFTLTDRDSGKSLAHFPRDEEQAIAFGGQYPNATAPFVGVGGSSTTLKSLQTADGNINIGFLEPRRVPTMALGFDSLTILVLNAPNLGLAGFGPAPLDDTQQAAIVDWVRSGGTLILWPGDGGLPASGPIGEALPAKVGTRQDIALSPDDVSAMGLPKRIKTVAAYSLEPRSGAERIPLLNSGQTSAYATRLGLGRIVLAPTNIAELQIDDTNKSRDLWRPLLKGIYAFNGDVASGAVDANDPANAQISSPNYGYDNGRNDDDSRQNTASMQIADFLGNVPGAGQIGFSYIAYVLLGLMLVVGPVDWFVLKRLGRQPWTWVTTSGWVALVTTGAIFAGYLFKSGDLHYKTLQTIDQTDNATVGSTDFLALYSSRTRDYKIETDPDGWWQPAGINEYGGSGLKLDVDFHQTNAGNTPEKMLVNVWSLRFLRGDHAGAGPPVISANLKIEISSDGVPHVVGTVKNLTSHPLKNVRVTTHAGSNACTLTAATPPGGGSVTQIAPLTAVNVQAALLPETQAQSTQQPNFGYRYEQYEAISEPNLWRVAADLNVRRGNEMAKRVATGKYAIIYAETDNPTPAAKLSGEPAIEHYWQFIRALVELHDHEAK